MFAGQWGDGAPAGSTTTIPELRIFEQSILNSDAIQVVSEMVQVRNNLGQPIELDTLAYVINFFGGNIALIPQEPNNIASLGFEVLVTLYANHGPTSQQVNAAEFIADWNAALASDAPTAPLSTPAMDALLTKTFPGVNLAVYKLNKQLYQAQLAASQAASAAGAQSGPTPGRI